MDQPSRSPIGGIGAQCVALSPCALLVVSLHTSDFLPIFAVDAAAVGDAVSYDGSWILQNSFWVDRER